MTAERDLDKLLNAMSPELLPGEYVFCTFPDAQYGDHSDLEPIAAISESEGLSLVMPRSKADESGLNYESVFKGITLGIHSSLNAVGLTAAFSKRLADKGISANVIAGYFHDHVFVQSDLAGLAIEVLEDKQGQS